MGVPKVCGHANFLARFSTTRPGIASSSTTPLILYFIVRGLLRLAPARDAADPQGYRPRAVESVSPGL